MSRIKLSSENQIDSYCNYLNGWVDKISGIAHKLYCKVDNVKGWEDSAFVKIVETVNDIIKDMNHLMDYIASLQKAVRRIGSAASKYCRA